MAKESAAEKKARQECDMAAKLESERAAADNNSKFDPDAKARFLKAQSRGSKRVGKGRNACYNNVPVNNRAAKAETKVEKIIRDNKPVNLLRARREARNTILSKYPNIETETDAPLTFYWNALGLDKDSMDKLEAEVAANEKARATKRIQEKSAAKAAAKAAAEHSSKTAVDNPVKKSSGCSYALPAEKLTHASEMIAQVPRTDSPPAGSSSSSHKVDSQGSRGSNDNESNVSASPVNSQARDLCVNGSDKAPFYENDTEMVGSNHGFTNTDAYNTSTDDRTGSTPQENVSSPDMPLVDRADEQAVNEDASEPIPEHNSSDSEKPSTVANETCEPVHEDAIVSDTASKEQPAVDTASEPTVQYDGISPKEPLITVNSTVESVHEDVITHDTLSMEQLATNTTPESTVQHDIPSLEELSTVADNTSETVHEHVSSQDSPRTKSIVAEGSVGANEGSANAEAVDTPVEHPAKSSVCEYASPDPHSSENTHNEEALTSDIVDDLVLDNVDTKTADNEPSGSTEHNDISSNESTIDCAPVEDSASDSAERPLAEKIEDVSELDGIEHTSELNAHNDMVSDVSADEPIVAEDVASDSEECSEVEKDEDTSIVVVNEHTTEMNAQNDTVSDESLPSDSMEGLVPEDEELPESNNGEPTSESNLHGDASPAAFQDEKVVPQEIVTANSTPVPVSEEAEDANEVHIDQPAPEQSADVDISPSDAPHDEDVSSSNTAADEDITPPNAPADENASFSEMSGDEQVVSSDKSTNDDIASDDAPADENVALSNASAEEVPTYGLLTEDGSPFKAASEPIIEDTTLSNAGHDAESTAKESEGQNAEQLTKSTYIGSTSLHDFLSALGLLRTGGLQKRTVSQLDIAEVFADAFSPYEPTGFDLKNRFQQRQIWLGGINLRQFLDLMVFDEKDMVTDQQFITAFMRAAEY